MFFDPSDPDGTSYDLRASAGFIERFHPSSFDKSLESDESIVSYFNHDSNRKLGETDGGTLHLKRDASGVVYSIPIRADDADHQYVTSKISSGIVRGSSIHAFIRDYSIQRTASGKIVTITDAMLFEIGPVAKPAYSATDAILRNDPFVQVLCSHDSGHNARTRSLRMRALQCHRH